MAGRKLKALTYRVEGIPPGTTDVTLIKDHFHEEDQQHLVVKSLCPSVDETDELTATVLFRPSEVRGEGPRCHSPSITVDRDFNGFTPLYVPSEDKQLIAADIIAISGLAGHAFGSWAHSDEGMWLRDYLPKYAGNARIMTYGYTSELQHTSSFSSLQDYSRTFLLKLVEMRVYAKCDGRPLIFVGHSLGCLLIKKALTDAGQIGKDSSRLPVRAIFFLAAPHQGLNTTAIRALIKGQPTEDLVRELEQGSSLLEDMNSKFIHIADELPIWTFYETRMTKTVVMGADGKWTRDGPAEIMVTRDSAQLRSRNERCLAADSDHSGIAKLRRGQGGIFTSISFNIRNSLCKESFDGAAPHEIDRLGSSPSTSYRSMSALEAPPVPLPVPNTPAQSTFCNPLSTQEDFSLLQVAEKSKDKCEKDDVDLNSSPMSEVSSQKVATGENESYPFVETIPSAESEKDQDATAAGNKPSELQTLSCASCPSTFLKSTIHWRCLICPINGSDVLCQNQNDGDPPYCSKHKTHFRKVCAKFSPYRDRYVPYVDPNPSSSDNAIVRAIKLNDNKELERSADNNPALLSVISERYKALKLAAYLGRVDCARVLLARGALEEDSESQTVSPLILAIRYDHIEVVRALLNHGIDVNRAGYNPYGSAISYAASNGQSNMVALLLEHHAALHLLDTDSQTALHRAAACGDEVSVSLLLNARANPNAQSRSRNTPLHIAVNQGYFNIVALLLKYHARPNVLNYESQTTLPSAISGRFGSTPLQIAVNQGHFNIVALLLKHHATPIVLNEDSQTALHRAASCGDEKSVSLLLDAGGSANAADINGDTPPHLAAAWDQCKIIKMLLSKYANLDVKNDKRETPLHIAVMCGYFKAAKLLLKVGANPNTNTAAGNGDTPLHTAARKGFTTILDLLLKHKANTTWMNNRQKTPLLVAAEAGQTEACSILLDANADVNWISEYDETALGLACLNGQQETLDLLLERGAAIDLSDSAGRTCLYEAVEAGDLGLCEYLLNHGASPDTEPPYAYNAVALAAQRGHLDILKCLLAKGALGMPPKTLKGKWKNLQFDSGVSTLEKNESLRLLREAKHKAKHT